MTLDSSQRPAYGRVILRRQRLIVTSVAIVMGISIFGSLRTPKTYVASAHVLVERQTSPLQQPSISIQSAADLAGMPVIQTRVAQRLGGQTGQESGSVSASVSTPELLTVFAISGDASEAAERANVSAEELLAFLAERSPADKYHSNAGMITERATWGLLVAPDHKRNAIVGMIVGFLFGIGLAFTRDYFEDLVWDSDDVGRSSVIAVLSRDNLDAAYRVLCLRLHRLASSGHPIVIVTASGEDARGVIAGLQSQLDANGLSAAIIDGGPMDESHEPVPAVSASGEAVYVLVAKARVTRRKALHRSIAIAQATGVKLAGVVLEEKAPSVDATSGLRWLRALRSSV